MNNFNSQICTTKEQSERLLKLGLKPETADMVHYKSASMKIWGILATPFDDGCSGLKKYYYPAWSLHRLIEMYNPVGDGSLLKFENITYKLLINCISMAIATGLFPKQYLNK